MIRKIIFFFPLQLLLVNLKRNHLLLLFWLILFGFVGKWFAIKYGIPYLFLAPEYLDTVSFWSYAIMGFSIGGFVMVYNISSYIINSKRFPFIATLKRPFVKFCINNSLLPLIFIIYYIYQVVNYHLVNENTPVQDIILYSTAIIIGYTINVVISLTYFLSTNKNIFKLLGIVPSDNSTPTNSLFSREESIFSIIKNKNKWHVGLYLHSPFKVRYVRDINHYDHKMMKSVMSQNKINAAFFEIVIFISLLVLGLFSENRIFVIPAGASITLFFTIIFILTSAFYTWLKGWTTIILVGVFVLFNYLSKSGSIHYNNEAYGLNYNTEKAIYSVENLQRMSSNSLNINEDKKNAIKILNNWKNKNKEKPKLIFINTSGGGSRATMWTFFMLQHLDSLSKNQLLKQTHLITGSSGGMIGAAYYRELLLQENLSPSKSSQTYLQNTGKDLLNPVAFSIATNDWFFRLKSYNDGKYTYAKDRGFAFEKQLLINTDHLLDKRLSDYTKPEFEAKIPQLILSPTVINDGRRMLISSQPISFLSKNNDNPKLKSSIENFEFSELFKNQDASNLKFTSALRMSATFPVIMPKVSLPTEPQITVMDAGMRDNYGSTTTYKYINTFKEWIENNTSGIIIISLRDKPKSATVQSNAKSIVETLFSPVGSLYSNLFPIQDYNQDQMLSYLSTTIKQPIEVFNFELENTQNNIALSWHLTTKEKEKIMQSVYNEGNQHEVKRLLELLNN
jgi:hypothetical protein